MKYIIGIVVLVFQIVQMWDCPACKTTQRDTT